MPKPLAESTRRKLIESYKRSYEDEFIHRKDDYQAQEKAAFNARLAADNHFVLKEGNDAQKWYIKAVEALRRSASLHPSWLKDPEFTARQQLHIGKYLWMADDIMEARKYLLPAAETFELLLKAAEKEDNRKAVRQHLVDLAYVYMYAGLFEKAYPYAERYNDIKRREMQVIKKTKTLPKLSASDTVHYDLCRAIVEKDKDAMARAKKGLESHIRWVLASPNARGPYSDLLLMAERAEKEFQE